MINQCVWLYVRFSLSDRDVEIIMAERGLTVSFETVRRWCNQFGCEYSTRLRRCCRPVGDTWHLDEEYLKTNGQFQYLWRAVDQEGQVIDILVQNRRDSIAAERSRQLHVLIPRPQWSLSGSAPECR